MGIWNLLFRLGAPFVGFPTLAGSPFVVLSFGEVLILFGDGIPAIGILSMFTSFTPLRTLKKPVHVTFTHAYA